VLIRDADPTRVHDHGSVTLDTGTIISFHIDGATGACIVLVQAFAFVLAFLFAPKYGLVWKGRRSSDVAAPSALS